MECCYCGQPGPQESNDEGLWFCESCAGGVPAEVIAAVWKKTRKERVDDELVNFVIGLIDRPELAKRLNISEEKAQELIDQRVHLLSFPPQK